MKTVYLSLFVALLTGLFSCQQAEDISFLNSEKANFSVEENEIIENDMVRFLYKGKTYVSECQTIGENVIIQDEVVANLAEKFSLNKTLATYIHSDGTLEYFDSSADLEASVFFEKSLATRAGFESKVTDSGVLTIFEDSKCKGDSWKFTINSTTTHIELANLGDHWNDRISSIDMVCNYRVVSGNNPYPPLYNHGNKCIATFYEHENFEGGSVWFSVDPSYPSSYIHYFKSLPLYPGSSKNWNDRATSLKFSFDSWKS